MNLYVWGLTIFAAFGGFMFGYDTGVINGVKEMPGFRETLGLSDNSSNESTGSAVCNEDVAEGTILGLIVSTFSLGCLVGAITAGGISDWVGRKPTIMVGGVIFTVGGLLQSSAFFIWMMLLGRIIAGVGVGVLSMVVPVYNAELAPKALRGRLVSLNQLAITAGIMVSFLTNLVCATFFVGWRVSLGIQCIFGFILIFGMIFLPETPRWLVKKHRDVKASKVLARLRRSSEDDVKEELTDIQLSLKECSIPGKSWWWSWRALLTWRMVQSVAIGVAIQVFQQFTGINVIMYYSTAIFCQIGVKEYISTAVVGTLNFLATILAIFLVDMIGRKVLLLIGALGMMVSMAAAATLILVYDIEDSEEENMAVGYVVVILICFFVFNFAIGWGPIAWVVTSEIFPLGVRSAAVSITTAANWTGNFVVAMLTPILIASSLHIHGTFYILSGALLVAFFFVLFSLPETKGESLERIEEIFAMSWLKRTNLFYYLRCGCPWQCRSNSRFYRPEHLSSHASHVTKDEDVDEDDKALLLGENSRTDQQEDSPLTARKGQSTYTEGL